MYLLGSSPGKSRGSHTSEAGRQGKSRSRRSSANSVSSNKSPKSRRASPKRRAKEQSSSPKGKTIDVENSIQVLPGEPDTLQKEKSSQAKVDTFNNSLRKDFEYVSIKSQENNTPGGFNHQRDGDHHTQPPPTTPMLNNKSLKENAVRCVQSNNKNTPNQGQTKPHLNDPGLLETSV